MGRFAKNTTVRPAPQSYAIRVPHSNTATRPTAPVTGQVRYNDDTSYLEAYYNGTWNNLAKEGVVQVIKDSSDAAAKTGATLQSADGVRTTFTMSRSYTSGQEAQVLIYVGNIYQNPTVAFTFNGTTTITFTSAPPLGQTIVILHGLASTITLPNTP